MAMSILQTVDGDLRTGLVFYGRDFSADKTIFYRCVVDRLEMYLFFLTNGMVFSDLFD